MRPMPFKNLCCTPLNEVVSRLNAAVGRGPAFLLGKFKVITFFGVLLRHWVLQGCLLLLAVFLPCDNTGGLVVKE